MVTMIVCIASCHCPTERIIIFNNNSTLMVRAITIIQPNISSTKTNTIHLLFLQSMYTAITMHEYNYDYIMYSNQIMIFDSIFDCCRW